MEIIFFIGRLLYGGFFLMMGINHFKNIESMSGYAASKGIRSSRMAVYFSGLLILLGGLGVMTGLYPKVSLALIAIFLLFVSFKMHRYWKEGNSEAKMIEMSNFMKNMALLGAALMMMSLPEPWEISF